MASQLEIANWAMTLIGEGRLSSISDPTGNAELVSAGWAMVRDNLLSAPSAWSFAIQRAALAADTDAPAWGFSAQYTIAGDVVRVLQVSETYPGLDLSDNYQSDGRLFVREADKILTDLGAPLYVKWIVNSVDVGLWHASFAKLMACDLAEFVNPRATESDSIAKRIALQRQQAWLQAAIANAIEQPSEPPADGSFMAAHAL